LGEIVNIKTVSVRGYRTVKEEFSFEIDRMVTLVGPNNTGKTNTLKGIQMFFTGYENDLRYHFEKDMCKGERSLRTNIQLTIGEIDSANDPELTDIIKQIRHSLSIATGSESEITLYLTFSPNSNPVYRVFPNARRPPHSDGVAYSRLERRLFEYILNKISVHYIPSEKSVGDLYRGLVMPHLFKRMHKELSPHLLTLNTALKGASDEINEVLKGAGLASFQASFELPEEPEDFFRNVGFNLKDTNTTSVFQKGMGIQSAVLLSSFCWIARQEKADGKLSLWLLEEPESYLHPELAAQCLSLLGTLSKDSQVIVTTHSLGFVPQDPEQVLGVNLENGWTKASKFSTYFEATKQIRQSLGVKFSDYYNFSEYNILVEGQIDRKYINYIIGKIQSTEALKIEFATLASQGLSVHDYGGVKGIEGFLRAAFEFVRLERATVSLFDGDDAGDKARKDLQQYFGRKAIPFQANADFVILRDRFSVEGLLPDQWIKEIHSLHQGWFDGYAEDASGQILPFKIKDTHKEQYYNWFVTKANSESTEVWLERWRPVLNVCESTLKQQGKALYKNLDRPAKRRVSQNVTVQEPEFVAE
jgi:predicted ATP-dependent endonuclease of OLD family